MATKFVESNSDGGGSCSTIASSNPSTPFPVFAETKIAFDASIPITSSICFLILSGSDEGNQFYLIR